METVGDLNRMGGSLYLTCQKCWKNERTLDCKEAFDLFGPFMPLAEIRRIAKCSRCGAKGAGWVQVDWDHPK